MNSLKRHKQNHSNRIKPHNALATPQPPQPAADSHPTDRKQVRKIHKKEQNKAQTRLQELSSKKSLFQSLRDLPLTKISKQKKQRMRTKEDKNIVNQHKNEDSTASRDFRQYVKNYDHPNGEYFGSRVTSLDNKKTSTRSKHSKNKNFKSEKGASSLQKCIREYRRLSSQHKSQSQSLKSQISDQQLRRLQKMQSIQKKKVVEDIIWIESRRLRLKKIKSDFRL